MNKQTYVAAYLQAFSLYSQARNEYYQRSFTAHAAQHGAEHHKQVKTDLLKQQIIIQQVWDMLSDQEKTGLAAPFDNYERSDLKINNKPTFVSRSDAWG